MTSERFKELSDDSRTSSYITLEDGRRLSYRNTGHYDGPVVFDFHGSPSSRNNLMIRGFTLNLLGVRMVSFDRPGYGESDSNPGRTVADTADDVRQLAEALHVDRFSLLARSGGVPHALGCAALLSEQVSGMLCMASVAPRSVVADWDADMTADNQAKHNMAMTDFEALERQYNEYADAAKNNKNVVLDLIRPDLPASDALLLVDSILRSMISNSHAEGLRVNGNGWLEDTQAVNGEWGFDVADVDCPTVLLHGNRDPFVGAQHTHALRDAIPGAASVIYQDFGHFGGLRVIEKSLAYLRGTKDRELSTRDQLKAHFSIPLLYDAPIVPEVQVNNTTRRRQL